MRKSMKLPLLFWTLFFFLNNYFSHGFKAFNTVGYVNTESGTDSDSYRSVVIDSNNRIIAVGHTDANDGLIARYTADGNLDTSFNGTGYVNSEEGTNSSIYRIVTLDLEGRIIVIGGTDDDTDDGVIARYTTDGKLDTSFNSTGYINTEGDTNTYFFTDVAIDTNGNIVVCGLTDIDTSNGVIVRYTSAGLLDTTFNSPNGYINTEGGTDSRSFYRMVIDSNNRIVVIGRTDANDGLIARYTSAGVLDTTFNSTGYVITEDGTDSLIYYGIAIDSGNRIVVVGKTDAGDGLIARYTESGLLDTSFNGIGYVKTELGTNSLQYNSVAIDHKGNILVVGLTDTLNKGLIARFTPDGQLDTSFNHTGYINASEDTDAVEYYDIILQLDGKIIVAGETSVPDGLIARYLANGVLDSIGNWNTKNFREHYNYANSTVGLLK